LVVMQRAESKLPCAATTLTMGGVGVGVRVCECVCVYVCMCVCVCMYVCVCERERERPLHYGCMSTGAMRDGARGGFEGHLFCWKSCAALKRVDVLRVHAPQHPCSPAAHCHLRFLGFRSLS